MGLRISKNSKEQKNNNQKKIEQKKLYRNKIPKKKNKIFVIFFQKKRNKNIM